MASSPSPPLESGDKAGAPSHALPVAASAESNTHQDESRNSPTTVVSTRREITPGYDFVVTTPFHNETSAASNNHKKTLSTTSVKGSNNHISTTITLTTLSNDHNIATKEELTRMEEALPLPDKSAPSPYRSFRWSIFSVYRRMFTLVLIANFVAMIVFLCQIKEKKNGGIATYSNAATAASANFCVSVLMRNEHVINLLFRIACIFPVWVPLAIRRRAAKVYSYGGVHSGCGVAGIAWYIVFAVLAVLQFPTKGPIETGLAVTTGITLMLLIIILVFAYPAIRMKMHNRFEASHRYAGWSAILILWLQTLLLIASDATTRGQKFGTALIKTPAFWFLVVITACLIYPWLRLRSRKVQVEKLSKHATRLHFDYANLPTCHAVRLTDAPLLETHGFATIPNYADEEKGFSVLVSNAGDWTNKIINNPPKRLWVKGAPTVGVMRVALMFKKVLVVATGSGIGPSLSLMQAYPDYPMRVLWSAPNPEATFGEGIIRSIFRADPNAVIVDTKKTGRPDLVRLAYSMFIESECEAAIIISNPLVTHKVVYGLEARGLPAYGPIFDS